MNANLAAISFALAMLAVSCSMSRQISNPDIVGRFTVIDGPSLSITFEATGRYMESGVNEQMELVSVDAGTWHFDGRTLRL